MTYRQELEKEERIQKRLAAQLLYSFDNNMSRIKPAYKFITGSGEGFTAFWRDCMSRCTEGCIYKMGSHTLYDSDWLFTVFREHSKTGQGITRRKISTWEELVYRAEECEGRVNEPSDDDA